MMRASPWGIAVCSWSLQPKDEDELAEQVTATGVTGIQLALEPIRQGHMGVDLTRRRLKEAGLNVVSGMMNMVGEDYSTLARIRQTGGLVPDQTWPANRRAAGELARIAAELRLALVTFHAGFIPHAPADPAYAELINRLRHIASIYRGSGVQIALETGQETPALLDAFLGAVDPPAIGVNFDPANLILYGMGDPVAALKALGPRVAQVHIKDALPSVETGAWGEEVPVGQGAVDWAPFLTAVRECPAVRHLVIEREAGENRIGDVRAAREFLESALR